MQTVPVFLLPAVQQYPVLAVLLQVVPAAAVATEPVVKAVLPEDLMAEPIPAAVQILYSPPAAVH